MKKIKKIFLLIALVLSGLIVLGALIVGILNWIVVGSTEDQLLTPDQAAQLQDVDCILVLGCSVRPDGSLSDMLYDRMRRGVELYEMGAAPKLLVSGDHGQHEYNEVDAMKRFALEHGVPAEDVFMDHAGFSTYESMYRAKEIFGAKKIIIVTQEYHLYRAVYIAERLGMQAYGVSSDYREYSGQFGRDVRELLARVKDFFGCVFKPEPTYLGEFIPIWGNGNVTNDESSDY